MTSKRDPHRHTLSAAGVRRRQDILLLATNATRSRARRRLAGRSIAMVAAIVVTAAALRSIVSSHAPTPPTAVTPPVAPPTKAPAPAVPPRSPEVVTAPVAPSDPVRLVKPPRMNIRIETVRTDPALVNRLAIPRTVGGWETIGTDELLRQLGDHGLAGGVIVRDGRTTIWFSAATDER